MVSLDVVKVVRKVFEHTAFLGAGTDLVGFMFHYEAFIVMFAGKAAFVVGCMAVYACHAEEARQAKARAVRRVLRVTK